MSVKLGWKPPQQPHLGFFDSLVPTSASFQETLSQIDPFSMLSYYQLPAPRWVMVQPEPRPSLTPHWHICISSSTGFLEYHLGLSRNIWYFFVVFPCVKNDSTHGPYSYYKKSSLAYTSQPVPPKTPPNEKKLYYLHVGLNCYFLSPLPQCSHLSDSTSHLN